jgi:hypothetical protein
MRRALGLLDRTSRFATEALKEPVMKKSTVVLASIPAAVDLDALTVVSGGMPSGRSTNYGDLPRETQQSTFSSVYDPRGGGTLMDRRNDHHNINQAAKGYPEIQRNNDWAFDTYGNTGKRTYGQYQQGQR